MPNRCQAISWSSNDPVHQSVYCITYLVAVSLQLYQFSICPLCTRFFNTSRLRENGFHFPEDIFKCNFLNEKIHILIKVSLKFVPMGPFNKIPKIGSDNGLMPSRQQAIIWTNDGLVYWWIDALLALNELIESKVDLHLIFSLASAWHVLMLFIFNSSPPGQNGRRFADDVFKCIFVNEKICILIEISLKFVPKGLIDNKAALVQDQHRFR